MKKISVIVLLLLSFSILKAQENKAKISTIPSVTIQNVDGAPFKTSSIQNEGKPIILSFWATWCKPCIKELTSIAEVYEDWQKETGVLLVAVSVDDARTSGQVKAFVNGKSWDYLVLLDPNGDLKRAMNVVVVPHTFVVNGKGEIKWQHTSFSEGAELELINIVKKVAAGEEVQ